MNNPDTSTNVTRCLCCCALVLALFAGPSNAEQPKLDLRDIDGIEHRQSEWESKRAVVIFFSISRFSLAAGAESSETLAFMSQASSPPLCSTVRRPALLARSLVCVLVIVPAFAFALTRVFAIKHEVEVALVALAISPVPPLLPMKEQNTDDLRWMKLGGPIEHCSGKTLICGHTRQASGLPWVLPGTICIDTGVYDGDGWLTCLHVETGDYWQANNRGESRAGNVSALALKQ